MFVRAVAVGAVAAAIRLAKLPVRIGTIALFACATVGVVVARFAFFAAGML